MLNNIPISDHTRNYHYKSYIQQLYSFSSRVKNKNLGCKFFSKDAVTEDVNVMIPTVDDNSVLWARRKLIAESKEVCGVIIPCQYFNNSSHVMSWSQVIFII